MKKKKNLGFTLFELLVVISIIGILVAVATAAYSASQKRARDARRMEDMQMLQKALEQYYALSDGSYPDPHYHSGELTFDETVLMRSYPVDPKNSGTYIYDHHIGDADSYCYCAQMEDESKGNGSTASCSGWNQTPLKYYCVENLQ